MHPRTAATMIIALALLECPVPAYAQPAAAEPPGIRRFSLGGEFSGTISAHDDGFFTYTDYDQDTLRQLRVRLLGEWRLGPSLAVIGELRTLNADRGEAAAGYLRWRPFGRHDVTIQLGRIPPVAGAFARRAYGRDNPLLAAPLAYQYVTSLRPDSLPANADDLLAMRGRGWRPSYPIGSTAIATGIPLIASTRWHSGGEVAWRHGWFESAGAVTLGSPAAPLSVSARRGAAWSGRVAATLPSGLVIGLSGARGRWIDGALLDQIGGEARAHAGQSLVGADAEWGRGPWLLRTEWMTTTFRMPLPAADAQDLHAQSAFLEGRYRLTARWQVSARLDALRFGEIPGVLRQPDTWDANVTRLESAISYRLSRQLEVRGGWLQHWRDGGFLRRRGAPAVQALYWF